MEKFKDKIKALRLKRNITQQQLANDLKVSKQAVSKWEKGYSLPDVTSIELIASYFGVSADYLLNDNAEFDGTKKRADIIKAIAAKEKIVMRVSVCVLLAVVLVLSVFLGITVNRNRMPETVSVNGWEVTLTEYDDYNVNGEYYWVFNFYVYNSTDFDKYLEKGCTYADNVRINNNLYTNYRQTVEPKNGFNLSIDAYCGNYDGKFTISLYGTPILKAAVSNSGKKVEILR